MSTATLTSTTLAGTIASCVENGITYPLEYLKVREQLAIVPPNTTAKFSIPQFTSVMYRGCGCFMAGNALKTVLRFNVFNATVKSLSDNQGGRPSAPVVVVAGMMTGLCETLVVVPFESIKTTMIEASSVGNGAATGALPPLGAEGTQVLATICAKQSSSSKQHSPVTLPLKSSKPSGPPFSSTGPRKIRPAAPSPSSASSAAESSGKAATQGPRIVPVTGPKSTTQVIRDMYRYRGLRAFVQGFNPTVIRQVTNSMLRFTAWNSWAQVVSVDGEEKMSIYKVFAGTVVVSGAEAVITQPIDVIKTRMQTANGLALYGNSVVCAYRIFVEEGWKKMWAGLGPRWVRKWVSGGIMWAVYEMSFSRFDRSMREHPFK